MSKIAKAPGFTVSESAEYRQIPAERLKRFDGYYFILPTSKNHEHRLPVMGATAGSTHLEAVDSVPNSPTKNRASLVDYFRFKLTILDSRQQVEHPNGARYSAYFHMLPKTGFTPPQTGAHFAGTSSARPVPQENRPGDRPSRRQPSRAQSANAASHPQPGQQASGRQPKVSSSNINAGRGRRPTRSHGPPQRPETTERRSIFRRAADWIRKNRRRGRGTSSAPPSREPSRSRTQVIVG